MKRILSLLIVVAVVVGGFVLGLVPNKNTVLGIAPNVQAGQGCSVATLQGDYIWAGRTEFGPDGPQPQGNINVTVGVTTYDGKGNLERVQTISRNGVITEGQPGRGIYTLDSDCTGTETVGNVHWYLVMTGDGTQGELIRTDHGTMGLRSTRKR